MRGKLNWARGMALFIGLGVSGLSFGQSATATGITTPSEKRELAFFFPGVIDSVMVKEGERVKIGQVLAKLDDSIEKKELAALEFDAKSTARVEVSEANAEVKRVQFARKNDAPPGTFSPSDLEEAKIEALAAEKSINVEKDRQEQAKLKAEQQDVRIQKMQLRSPIEGVVQKVNLYSGEIADSMRSQQRGPQIVIVNNDVFHVEVRDLTSAQVQKLKVGDTLKVRYANDPDEEKNWHSAEIFFIDPMVDAASDTQLVKAKLPNPQGRPAGLSVVVKLPFSTGSSAGLR